MKKWFVPLLWIFSSSLFAYSYFGDLSEEVNAKVNLSKSQVSVVGSFNVEVEVRYPSTYQVSSLQFLDETKEGAFDFSEPYQVQSLTQDQRTISRYEVTYEPKIEGAHLLELPLIRMTDDKGNLLTLYPPSIEQDVIAAALDSQSQQLSQPLDLSLAPPIEINTSNKENLLKRSEEELRALQQITFPKSPQTKWGYTMPVLILVAGFLIRKWIKSRRKKAQELKEVKDPKQEALKALELLKSRKLPEKGLFEEFYVEITGIVRLYIERSYHVKAPEQTTQEFLQVLLSKSLFGSRITNYLEKFLVFADLVKFAKFHPQPQDCDQAHEAAKDFVLSDDESECR